VAQTRGVARVVDLGPRGNEIKRGAERPRITWPKSFGEVVGVFKGEREKNQTKAKRTGGGGAKRMDNKRTRERC